MILCLSAPFPRAYLIMGPQPREVNVNESHSLERARARERYVDTHTYVYMGLTRCMYTYVRIHIYTPCRGLSGARSQCQREPFPLASARERAPRTSGRTQRPFLARLEPDLASFPDRNRNDDTGHVSPVKGTELGPASFSDISSNDDTGQMSPVSDWG